MPDDHDHDPAADAAVFGDGPRPVTDLPDPDLWLVLRDLDALRCNLEGRLELLVRGEIPDPDGERRRLVLRRWVGVRRQVAEIEAEFDARAAAAVPEPAPEPAPAPEPTPEPGGG